MNKSFLDIMADIDTKFDITLEETQTYKMFAQLSNGERFQASNVNSIQDTIRTTWLADVKFNNFYNAVESIFLVNPDNIILLSRPYKYYTKPLEILNLKMEIEWGIYNTKELIHQAETRQSSFRILSSDKVSSQFLPYLTLKDLERLKII